MVESRWEWSSGRVVGGGLYNDKKGRICEDTLLALFNRNSAACSLKSRAVFVMTGYEHQKDKACVLKLLLELYRWKTLYADVRIS